METRAGDDKAPAGVAARAGPVKDLFAGLFEKIFGGQQGHLFPWAPVCFGAGVGVYFAMRSEPQWPEFVALFTALSLFWLWAARARRHRACWSAVILWALTLAALGAASASLRSHNAAAPVLSFRYYGPIEGRIVAMDRSASQMPRLTLDQVRLARIPPARTPQRVRISLHGPDLGIPFAPGDVVMTTGHLSPPSGPVEPGGYDFRRSLWFQQLGGLGYTRNPTLRSSTAQEHAAGLALRLYTARRSLSEGIKSRMADREGPFAAAIITGDRSDLDPSLLTALRASNLAHLLAISGLHMGLLTGAVFTLIRLGLALVPALALRLPIRKIAAVGALCAAFVYLGVSGANVATQRAFIMVSVMLLAICLERPALTLRAVAIAAFIVLLHTPEALVTPGFQMSFAATTALVAVFAALRDRAVFLALPNWLKGPASLLVSSFIAGAATAPFGAAHFNQFSQYGLLANLLSVPVMGFVVMPGALLSAALTPFGAEGAGLWVMQQGLAWILYVAQMVAGLEGSTRAVVAPGPWVLPLVSVGGLLLCLWQGRGRLLGLVPLSLALALWMQVERPSVLISDSGRLVGVMQDGRRGLNKPTGDGFAARVWLENDGDRADQTAAARRSGLAANAFNLDLGGRSLTFNAANPKDIDAPALCAASDLVVVPRVEVPLPKGCTGWTAVDFRRGGAVAISITDQGLRYENSRSRQGDRLWVPHPERRNQ